MKIADDDATALQFVISLLNNGTNTGLLDRITMDGEVSGADVSFDARRDQGRILVMAVPYYDANQQSYESNAATEKIVMTEINKIKNGDIPDWLIKSVKAEYDQNTKLEFEDPDSKIMNLVYSFVYDMPVEDICTMDEMS